MNRTYFVLLLLSTSISTFAMGEMASECFSVEEKDEQSCKIDLEKIESMTMFNAQEILLQIDKPDVASSLLMLIMQAQVSKLTTPRELAASVRKDQLNSGLVEAIKIRAILNEVKQGLDATETFKVAREDECRSKEFSLTPTGKKLIRLTLKLSPKNLDYFVPINKIRKSSFFITKMWLEKDSSDQGFKTLDEIATNEPCVLP